VKALHASKGRKATKQFIAEGPAALEAALRSKRFPIVNLYVTETGAELLSQSAQSTQSTQSTQLTQSILAKAVYLSEKVMASISTVESAQGVLAICSSEERLNEEEIYKKNALPLIYCFEVNDPGNLGTIIRTADALGAAGVLLSPGSADPFSPKVVRATAGSLWHIPLLREVDIARAIEESRAHGRKIYATDGQGAKTLPEVSGRDALWIFGNEARGLTGEITALADEVVSIPMRGRAESLNLATAVAITLFHANS
jgi:TrmH family RNA methyltransferase